MTLGLESPSSKNPSPPPLSWLRKTLDDSTDRDGHLDFGLRASDFLRVSAFGIRILPLFLALGLSLTPALAAQDSWVVLNDDGGWCWFEDPRVVIDGGKLVAGTVANGSHDPARKGDIEVVSYDLAGGTPVRSTLHKNLQADDHDSPALLQRPDGRWLALYAQHGTENRIYYRVSVRPHDATEWQPEKVFVPSPSTRVTYSNPHLLSRESPPQGRIYNFFRGYNNTSKPSWMFSDDLGESWTMGGLLIDFQAKRKQRPYVKYASDGRDTIHFAFTEGHPMEFDTGIYHAVYRAGQLYNSQGQSIRSLTNGPIFPSEATCIFAGDSNNIAWIHGIALDQQGRPRLAIHGPEERRGRAQGQGRPGLALPLCAMGRRPVARRRDCLRRDHAFTPARTTMLAASACTPMTPTPFSSPPT